MSNTKMKLNKFQRYSPEDAPARLDDRPFYNLKLDEDLKINLVEVIKNHYGNN